MGGYHILRYFEVLEEIEHLKINAAFWKFDWTTVALLTPAPISATRKINADLGPAL